MQLSGNSSNAKACSVCLDIFFTHFVYDAVLNPVKYGIIKDVVIGETCRFNLTQIVEVSLLLFITLLSVSQAIYSVYAESTY